MENNDWMTRAQVTILKYSYLDGDKRVYKFEVMDKYDIEDEADRLDAMILKSKLLKEQLNGYQQLWIKNTAII